MKMQNDEISTINHWIRKKNLLPITWTLAIHVFSIFSVQAAPIVTNGLIAYYAMDEGSGSVATDTSGTQGNGTISGATWMAGRLGNALSFDGSNDYVNLGEVNASGGTGFSCSLWFNANSFDIYDARLISKANGTAEQNHDWMISTQSSSGMKIRFRLKAGGNTLTLVGNSNISTGQWIHVVSTYDGSEMRLYQNNAADSTRSHSGAVNNTAGVSARIGQNPDGYGTFDGLIDEVRIYNRALTLQEVSLLFEETQGPLDEENPSVPGNLSGSAQSTTSVQIAWDAATDNIGVTGYRIYRDNVEVGTTAAGQLTYTDSGLNLGTSYSYEVSAFDAAGNESAKSSILNLKTLSKLSLILQEVQQFKISNSSEANVQNKITDYFGGASQEMILEWDASEDPVSGYILFQATSESLLTSVSAALADSNVIKYTTTALEQTVALSETTYFKVVAFDDESQYSAFSNIDIDGGDASTGVQEGALEVVVP